jgi:hypothetical protein
VTGVNKATDQGLMMAAFTFTCPTTSMKVQHWLDDDVPENEYEGIICAACARLHFLDRNTGKLLGQDKRGRRGYSISAIEPFSAQLDLQACSGVHACPQTFSRRRQAAGGSFLLKSDEQFARGPRQANRLVPLLRRSNPDRRWRRTSKLTRCWRLHPGAATSPG